MSLYRIEYVKERNAPKYDMKHTSSLLPPVVCQYILERVGFCPRGLPLYSGHNISLFLGGRGATLTELAVEIVQREKKTEESQEPCLSNEQEAH